MVGRMTNQPNHEAGADAAAFDFKGAVMHEAWRSIPAHGGGYEASSLGRIRNSATGRVLPQSTQKDSGRLQVGIWNAGRSTPCRVHILVALAFHGPRPEDMETRHLNGDQVDNRAANLRYGTHSENEQDKLAHGTNFHASKAECKNGHPFDQLNTYINPSSGQRVCRTCSRQFKAAYKARKRMEQNAQNR